VLLDLERRFALVDDRVDRNVGLVDLLEGNQVAPRRRPVAAQSVEFFLGDEFRQPVGGAGRV